MWDPHIILTPLPFFPIPLFPPSLSLPPLALPPMAVSSRPSSPRPVAWDSAEQWRRRARSRGAKTSMAAGSGALFLPPGMQHVGSLSHQLAVGKVLLSPLLSDDVTEGRLQWAPIGLSPWRHLMLPRTPPRHARWRGSPGRRHHPGFGSQGVQGVLAKLRSWPPRGVTPPDSQVAPGLDSPPPPRAMHGSATA